MERNEIKPLYQVELQNKRYNDQQRDRIFEAVCIHLINGIELVDILKLKDENYPSIMTFFYWLQIHPSYSKTYIQARAIKAHLAFDRLLQVAEGDPNINDNVVRVQRDRLITDTIKFYVAKVLPKTYGDKIDGGGDNRPVININLGEGVKPPEANTTEDVGLLDQ